MSSFSPRRCWAEVDLDAIRHNFALLQAAAGGARVMAVVKANAYGHGDVPVARALAAAGAACFGVATLAEALRLRGAGLHQPILVLGFTPPGQAAVLAQHRIAQCVFSAEYAEALSAAARAAGVKVAAHFKADTGMGRLGFAARHNVDEAMEQIARAAALPGLVPEGLFTHFAAADGDAPGDKDYTRSQFRRFSQLRQALAQGGLAQLTAHCCNSAGVAVGGMEMDMVRPGISLYGYQPGPGAVLPGLRPALRLKAAVAMLKQLQPGESVSYGRSFTAARPLRVATVAAGYADGYPRLLSGRGAAGFGGAALPVLGRVCMDQLVLNASEAPALQPGSAVTLLGGDGGDTVEQAAAKCGTISYEIVCGIGLRVPRVYTENGRETMETDYLAMGGQP